MNLAPDGSLQMYEDIEGYNCSMGERAMDGGDRGVRWLSTLLNHPPIAGLLPNPWA